MLCSARFPGTKDMPSIAHPVRIFYDKTAKYNRKTVFFSKA